MALSTDQVLALAPDTSSASAGKKLSTARPWRNLGRNDQALWGECQGSAIYQVRVDLSDYSSRCSCPSRKFPCKHALGLLLLLAASPREVPEAAIPEWVESWLSKRAVAATAASAKRVAQEQETTADPEQAEKRAQKLWTKRHKRILKGLDRLDLWMADLIRQGLAGLEVKPISFWEDEAARMVDAQAQGIAGRLRDAGALPNSGPDWPEQLLGSLGRLALLSHAVRRIDALDSALQHDVRQATGWTLKEEDVLRLGEAVSDRWIVFGQYVLNQDRLRTQRSWLVGCETGRAALVLQFAMGNAPFGDVLVPGTVHDTTLVYWPSAYPQRALIRDRADSARTLEDRLPGAEDFNALLTSVSEALAIQPWLERFPAALRDVVPLYEDGRWLAQDRSGMILPLLDGDYWHLLALSGGAPLDLAAEWDGRELRPLGAVVEGTYHVLGT